jgi:release factor H-coupled RctB family protein
MPDLHPGPGFPIGCAFKSESICLPGLIGGDIGCGMTLLEIPRTKASKFRGDRVVKKLERLDLRESYPNASQLLESNGLKSTTFDHQLGSIGGGNHFCEILEIEEIRDEPAFSGLGLDADSTLMLVHSGSRTFGQDVVQNSKELLTDAEDIDEYLQRHDQAVRWALANRMLIAHRVAEKCGWRTRKVIDIVHNYLQRGDNGEFIHRKGVGYVKPGELSIIPGSRGSFSYIVKMTEDTEHAEKHLCCIAHGAGRRWNRSTAEQHMKSKFPNPKKLLETDLGSTVVCPSKSLLYQEAPEAYKNVDDVIQDLINVGLVTVVAVMKPMLTFKQ